MKLNIVVKKTLNPGQKANVSAIIAGQFGRDVPALYTDAIIDSTGTQHAGISVNIVILDGNVVCIAFSTTGQMLSNNYTEYHQKISSSKTENTEIIGVGIYGDDEAVKLLTKKFSLTK